MSDALMAQQQHSALVPAQGCWSRPGRQRGGKPARAVCPLRGRQESTEQPSKLDDACCFDEGTRTNADVVAVMSVAFVDSGDVMVGRSRLQLKVGSQSMTGTFVAAFLQGTTSEVQLRPGVGI